MPFRVDVGAGNVKSTGNISSETRGFSQTRTLKLRNQVPGSSGKGSAPFLLKAFKFGVLQGTYHIVSEIFQ
jgi:hypothetical protein